MVPPGFAVELIHAAPDILWPSALHCFSDGSLLVAEDPMDMIGPTDQPIDRILLYRWTADGGFERTVFCERLYAVFGLEEIDGAVYVMNMPRLTVLHDRDGDGVAEERRELLTDLGPPAPGWPGGFNDHIVSGLRLGMDGWLYVSVGDKGIPGATGTDGSRITLRGGGVVRLRPDGSQLEVVARGTRNHLDVALDERDEIFTYDNTDDGLGWWTRLTHIVPTGRYGYPWDYGRHPERALPAMAEYGGGSPTGGLVYRGGVWPAPYPGSLFFCEWAKSALRRFELEPAGSSFRVVLAEDFMTAGALESFRPTDLCGSPDGRFLYVADWGYGGWTSDTKSGRLFRIRRADDRDPPRGVEPRLFREDSEEKLPNPNFRARLLAQRGLARLAEGEVRDEVLRLAAELLGPEQPDLVRRHILWLLEEIAHLPVEEALETRGVARLGLRQALGDASSELRAEAARALGSRRIGTAEELAPLLLDPDLRVRRQAAHALGRCGDPSAADALVECLFDPATRGDPFLRAAAREALRALGRNAPVLARLPGADALERTDLELVLRERYELPLASELARRVDPAAGESEEVRAFALELLASSARKEEPWDGLWWSIQPAKSPEPPKVVDWEGTELALAALRAALEDAGPAVRRAALEGIRANADRDALPAVRERFGREEDPALRELMLELFAVLRDSGARELLGAILADGASELALRRRAVEVASRIATPEMSELLGGAIADPALPAELAVAAIDALARLAAESERAEAALLGATRAARAELRAAAARALGELRAREHAARLRELLTRDPEPGVRGAAALALANLDLREALPEMLALLDDEATREPAIDALARMPDARALDAYLAGLEGRSAARREACLRALRVVRGEVLAALEGKKLAGELGEKVLAQLQAIYTEPVPIARWTLLGPIARNAAPTVAGGPPDLERTFERAELVLEPWQHSTTQPAGRVDLRALLGDASNQVAYASALYPSPAERTAEVVLGSDDSLALWVNGELVYDFGGDRAWAPEQARVRVKLAAGKNLFVARIGQTGGDWAFSVQVAPPGSGPLFEAGLVAAYDARAYRQYALANAGDLERGRAVFHDEKGPACSRCHALGPDGPRTGPYLGDVGLRYSRAELLTAILEPSLQVAEGYRTSWFELEDGEVIFGQVQREEDGVVWLVDTRGEPRQLLLGEVVDRGQSPLSLMPENLTGVMTREELADLATFLESLRGSAPGADAPGDADAPSGGH